jgi:hypothetical protein
MPRVTRIEATVNLPIIGEVTFLADYGEGFAGSYWNPPEPPEVSVISIQDSLGCQVHLTDEQQEDYYDLFLNAADEKYQDLIASHYDKYANSLEEDLELIAIMSADSV